MREGLAFAQEARVALVVAALLVMPDEVASVGEAYFCVAGGVLIDEESCKTLQCTRRRVPASPRRHFRRSRQAAASARSGPSTRRRFPSRTTWVRPGT